MSKITCTACGSDDVVKISQKETRQLTLGDEFTYDVNMYHCNECGEEGDFADKNDAIHERHMEEARKKLAAQLIDSIAADGMKMAYIERAFEIPQRTISSKWKNGSISASGLALLRIVKTMPWTVHIADNKFSNESIKQTIASVFGHIVKNEGVSFSYSHEFGETKSMHIHLVSDKAQQNKISDYEIELQPAIAK